MATSKSPFRAVAVCARTSLLISSTVSPTLAEASAGWITRLSMVIWIVAACPETDAPSMSATPGSIHLGIMSNSLLQVGGDFLGVLLMALEDLQAGLQQALQLRIAGGGNELGFQRRVDRLVVGDLIGDVGLVVGGAAQLTEFGELVGGVLRQRLAGVVVFRGDLQLLDEVERLLVHRFMVADHIVGERLDLLVAGFGFRLFGRVDVDHPGGVGDMRDLRVGRLRALRKSGAAEQADGGDRRAQSNEHDFLT